MYRTSPRDGTVHATMCHLSVEDRPAFFQYQWDQFLVSARDGRSTDLSFVSKSGEVVTAHKTLLLPLSSHLKLLVESSKSCGCAEDVHTLVLPDWDYEVIEAMVSFLYTGSVTLNGDTLGELHKLMHEMKLDISQEQLLAENTETHLNAMRNVIETKIGCVQGMKKVEIGTINKEHKNIIEKLEEVLNFFKNEQIENEEALVFMKKPLEDLQSSLKFIPIGRHFSAFPSEIKTDILSYLCDSDAYTAASVCQEWKQVLKTRFTNKTVSIGEPCCGEIFVIDCDKCSKDMKCLDPEVMLRASADHKLGVHLEISRSVKEVEPKFVTDGLTSASSFSLCGVDCKCDNDNDDSFESGSIVECEINPLSLDQLKDLFKCLEDKKDVMDKVNLSSLDLTELDQDRLANCLINKVRRLELSESKHHEMLNVETLIRKLAEESTESKLNHLYLYTLKIPDELTIELANALCNVEYVELRLGYYNFSTLKLVTVKQLIQNIANHQVKIKNLMMWKCFDFRKQINSKDLKKFLSKMIKLRLHGHFSPKQIKAAESVPDVSVFNHDDSTIIHKGLSRFS